MFNGYNLKLFDYTFIHIRQVRIIARRHSITEPRHSKIEMCNYKVSGRFDTTVEPRHSKIELCNYKVSGRFDTTVSLDFVVCALSIFKKQS